MSSPCKNIERLWHRGIFQTLNDSCSSCIETKEYETTKLSALWKCRKRAVLTCKVSLQYEDLHCAASNAMLVALIQSMKVWRMAFIRSIWNLLLSYSCAVLIRRERSGDPETRSKHNEQPGQMGHTDPCWILPPTRIHSVWVQEIHLSAINCFSVFLDKGVFLFMFVCFTRSHYHSL